MDRYRETPFLPGRNPPPNRREPAGRFTIVWPSERSASEKINESPWLNRLRKKACFQAKPTKNIPQGLKPKLYFVTLAARLKSCPFTKQACYRVFPQPVKPL